MVGARTPERFVGYWRTEYLDLVVPAFIEFDRERMGQFQFGTVRGWLDCRFGERDGVPVVDFSWEGENDNDPGCGRGWGALRGTASKGGCTFTAATTLRSWRRGPLGLCRRSGEVSRPRLIV